MDFGMPTLIELNDLEETAVLCRELGLQFIELNMNLPQYQVEALEQTEKLQKIQERYGIYFTIHLDENLNVCDFNRAVSNAYLETVIRTIEVAKKLHIPVLNMHMHPGVYFTLPDKKVHLYEIYQDSYLDDIRRFRSLCDAAVDGSDIKISIENTNGYLDFEKASIEYLLRSETFTLTFDVGHSHVQGNIDEPFLLVHNDKLRHFHIHDAIGKSNHLTLGEGEINLPSYLLIAEQCGARCVIEVKTIEALKASVMWMNASMQ